MIIAFKWWLEAEAYFRRRRALLLFQIIICGMQS